MKEATISDWSVALPRLTAAISPIVMPMITSHSMAPTISSRLAGNRDTISSVTSERWM